MRSITSPAPGRALAIVTSYRFRPPRSACRLGNELSQAEVHAIPLANVGEHPDEGAGDYPSVAEHLPESHLHAGQADARAAKKARAFLLKAAHSARSESRRSTIACNSPPA